MPSDLWYFYESDLNKCCLTSFYNSLPDHLRRMLKDSLPGVNISDSVLQGYRGPHTNGGSGDSEYLGASNGLQEVRYWWGVSKHFLWVPVVGTVVFGAGRAFQDTDWHSLYFDSKTEECLSHDKNKAAEKLSVKGHQLFRAGKYAEAAEYYNNAYLACSSGYKNEQEFKNDRDRAKAEEVAVNLNSQGERLFSEGKYTEALVKYQEAYDKSNIKKEYDKYRSNKERAKAEIDAINLNSQGDHLFGQSKYTEALIKYQEACDKSKIRKEYDKYQSNKERAKAEIDAINFNSAGDHLFGQSKYTEALIKYQEACDKSKIRKEYDKYQSNKERAKAEIDAINLSLEGDNLFCEVKYDEAVRKYQAAYDKSLVKKEKKKYASSKNNAEDLKNRLSLLDTLWKEAWEAENDTSANDRSGEAEELFQRVLSETKDSLKVFPDNLRFKQYEILVSLKIDGNELFNEGLEAQQDGSKLLQEAEELKLKQKFESALIKYKEAKSKFSESQEKFKTGREKDSRFVSCIDFVQGQLDVVLQSIEVIEQRTLSSRLLNLDISISKSNRFEADSCLCDITGDHNNYYKQI